MDNITHSLIGIAVGEAVFQYRAKKSAGLDAKLRPFYWLSSLIGNNIPDIDSLFAPILTGGKIGYLLHHRGYTHTLIFALPQAFFCLLALWLLTRYQKSTFSKKEWGIITLLSAFGVFTHIFADSWNSYGVHPFWPWNSRWFYGDTLFILEPWIWMCLLPALYFASFHKVLRIIFGSLFLLLIGLIWFSGFIPQPIQIILSITAILFLFTKTLTSTKRIFLALGSIIFILLSFNAVQLLNKNIIQNYISQHKPHSKLIDIILSPYPANPFCWQTIVIESVENISLYRMELGIVAPFSQAISAAKCGNLRYKKSTAPLKMSALSNTETFHWIGTFEAPLSELRELNKNYCWVNALLKFTRAPFWIIKDTSITFGDLRYDREEHLGFTEMRKNKNDTEKCPQNIPSWLEPRAEIL